MAATTSVADSLSDKFAALFPTWTTIIATLIALFILILILTKYFYKPVKKMHDDRKNYIQKQIDDAEKFHHDGKVNLEKAEKEISQALSKANVIIANADAEAELVKLKKLAETDAIVKKMKEDAKQEIAQEQAKFEQNSEKLVIDLALAAASKIVEKEVSDKDSEKVVKDFLKKASSITKK